MFLEHREEITKPQDLLPRVKDMNSVFEGVVSTREAAIDAEGFKLLSSIGKEQAEASAGELVFDPLIFAEKLVSYFDNSELSKKVFLVENFLFRSL